MRESQFQSLLIKEIKRRLPGCIVLKNDPTYILGIPDLTVLYEDKWAFLECKQSGNSALQSLQDYYINKANDMSFGRFVFPENKQEVLDELESALRSDGKARFSRRQ